MAVLHHQPQRQLYGKTPGYQYFNFHREIEVSVLTAEEIVGAEAWAWRNTDLNWLMGPSLFYLLSLPLILFLFLISLLFCSVVAQFCRFTCFLKMSQITMFLKSA